MHDDDPTHLRERLRELERERAELLARLGGPGDPPEGGGAKAAPAPAMSGRTVVRVLVGIFALALAAASAIWYGGRTPWRARPIAEGRPDTSREDIAGQALVQVLHACLAELDPGARVDVRLRVALAPNGSASLKGAEAQPGGLAEACARRAPSLVRTRPEPDARPLGLEVRFSSQLDPDGTRVSRSGWAKAAL